MRARFVRRILLASAASLLAFAGTASAGGFHVHIGGGAHFSGGAHWGGGWSGGYRGPHVHWGYHPSTTVTVRGGIWVGGGSYWGGYYNPYYYPTYYAQPPTCECGPNYYPPVYPAPSSYSTMAAPAPQPPAMPTFGVGLFAGGTTTSTSGGDVSGDDVGLFANLRISRGLLIQGEMGKTTLADSQRVDKRFEGALVWEIGAENSWAPYLLGGLGVESADTSDTSATQNFAELGVGLRWALSRNIHITADIRAGSRSTMSDSQTGAPGPARTLSTVAPPPADSGQNEDFTRVRLGAMLYF